MLYNSIIIQILFLHGKSRYKYLLNLEFVRRYYRVSRLNKLSKSNIAVLRRLETTIMNVCTYLRKNFFCYYCTSKLLRIIEIL